MFVTENRPYSKPPIMYWDGCAAPLYVPPCHEMTSAILLNFLTLTLGFSQGQVLKLMTTDHPNLCTGLKCAWVCDGVQCKCALAKDCCLMEISHSITTICLKRKKPLCFSRTCMSYPVWNSVLLCAYCSLDTFSIFIAFSWPSVQQWLWTAVILL